MSEYDDLIKRLQYMAKEYNFESSPEPYLAAAAIRTLLRERDAARELQDRLREALSVERQRARMPDEVAKFLLGEGPLEGVWFGDRHPARKGLYWWRTMLREVLAWHEQEMSNE